LRAPCIRRRRCCYQIATSFTEEHARDRFATVLNLRGPSVCVRVQRRDRRPGSRRWRTL